MKTLTYLSLLLIITSLTFCDRGPKENKSELEAQMNAWDIMEYDKGAIMFLDVPYRRDNSENTEYITISVVKENSNERPKSIKFIIPGNIEKSKDVSLHFANYLISKDSKPQIEFSKGEAIMVSLKRFDDEDYYIEFPDGYYLMNDSNEYMDIFDMFLNWDRIFMLLHYPDESQKSIMISLTTFKNTYNSL